MLVQKRVEPGPVLTGREGPIVILSLNRPEALNALTVDLLENLEHALNESAADSGVRAVVITGSGPRSFCAGADLKALTREGGGRAQIDALVDAMHRVFERIERFDRPVIAAIQGYCLGGGLELALSADLRVAADDARLGLPEAKIGTIPGGGGTQRLSRLVGPARAKELMFTSEPIDAVEARRIGLVNRVVPATSVIGETMALAALIAKCAPLSLRAIKEAVTASVDVDLETGLQLERACHDALQDTADRGEGIRAFLEKRLPVFCGR